MMKNAVLSLVFLLVSVASNEMVAQQKSAKLKPQWITHSVPAESLFHFFTDAYGESTTLDGARQRSFVNLTTKLEHERGIVVNSRFSGRTHMSRDTYTKTEQFDMECVEHGKEISVICKTVDEYWEKTEAGLYKCHLLYAVANSSDSGYAHEHISVTSSYGIRGLWRSMLVPGWGQMHKGAYVKGSVILGGTIALAGGIIFTENMRQSCLMQMSQTHSAPVIKQLSANMTNWSVGRNVCIGAVAALYAYNLVDAVVAPGARRVVVTPGYMAVRF